jgi:hypothetical protein
MKKITLVAIDGLGTESIEYENLCYSIKSKFKCLNITEILFITPNKIFKNKFFNIKYLEKSLNYLDLNVLMLQKLSDYSDGEYFLIVQPDGYPLNLELWDNSFLDYDYIGAPWPAGMRWTGNSPVVGNGGFSIRSKKLYELTKKLQGYEEFHKNTLTNEDVMISVVLKDYLKQNNCTIAPVEVARNFSVEIPLDDNHSINTAFGYHGKSHLNKMKENQDARLL